MQETRARTIGNCWSGHKCKKSAVLDVLDFINFFVLHLFYRKRNQWKNNKTTFSLLNDHDWCDKVLPQNI